MSSVDHTGFFDDEIVIDNNVSTGMSINEVISDMLKYIPSSGGRNA